MCVLYRPHALNVDAFEECTHNLFLKKVNKFMSQELHCWRRNSGIVYYACKHDGFNACMNIFDFPDARLEAERKSAKLIE